MGWVLGAAVLGMIAGWLTRRAMSSPDRTGARDAQHRIDTLESELAAQRARSADERQLFDTVARQLNIDPETFRTVLRQEFSGSAPAETESNLAETNPTEANPTETNPTEADPAESDQSEESTP